MVRDRVKELRLSLSLTQQEFADRLGIKRNTIAKYETGLNNPTDSVVALICKTWNVNLEWLKEGKGEMYLSSPMDALEAYCKENNLGREEAIFLRDFVSLPPAQRRSMLEFMVKVVDDIRSGSEKPYTEEDYKKDLGIVVKEESTTSNISEGTETA